jgi:hypothetical protein
MQVVIQSDDEANIVIEDSRSILFEGGGNGDVLHADLSDTAITGHPASVITIEVPLGLVATEVQSAIEELLTKLNQHDHSDSAPVPASGLDIVNAAADRYLLSYDSTEGRLKWLTSTEYIPNQLSVGVGTIITGSIASLLTKNDGNTLDILEVLGIPGFDLQVRFQNVVSFNVIRLFMRYTGGHTCQVQLFNPNTTTWVSQSSFNSQNGLIDFSISVDDGVQFVSVTGDVYLRFYHPSTGIVTHHLYLDAVHLLDSTTGGGGITDHSGLSGRSIAEAHPATAIELSTVVGMVADNVQSAISELNTMKVSTSQLDGFAKITVNANPPSNPSINDLWVEPI